MDTIKEKEENSSQNVSKIKEDSLYNVLIIVFVFLLIAGSILFFVFLRNDKIVFSDTVSYFANKISRSLGQQEKVSVSLKSDIPGIKISFSSIDGVENVISDLDIESVGMRDPKEPHYETVYPKK